MSFARIAAFLLLWLGLTWLLASATGPALPPDPLVSLGKRLLSERRLAADGRRACLDCHQPDRGFTDGLSVATADGLNTATLWGLAGRSTFGWFTPEVATLEAAALAPLANPREMGPLAATTLARLRADPALRAAYAAAFPVAAEPISWPNTAAALAAAIRTLPSPPTGPLSPAVLRGEALFAELGCGACHRGPGLNAEAYLRTGVSPTKRNGGRVRVPSLLGLAHTAPYFHDGSAATLDAVVRAYERGGLTTDQAEPLAIAPFLLTDAERSDLVAFLHSR